MVKDQKKKAMKRLLIAFAVIGLGFGVSSCSKCYTCTSPVTVRTANGSTTTYQEDELCTASADELKAKEDQGYDCTAS